MVKGNCKSYTNILEINFGCRYSLEMHLVHTNMKYNGSDYMYYEDGLAVIGLFANVGKNSKMFKVRNKIYLMIHKCNHRYFSLCLKLVWP